MADPSGEAAVDGSASFRDDPAHLFSKAMAQTRMAVCLSDPHAEDMPIVFANRAFLELTGYDDHEVVGRNCRFLQGPDTEPDTVRAMGRALADEEVVVMEVLNYRKDGTRFWNALHLGPLYDEEGALQYYFGSQWDVTDVRAARAGEQHAKLMARELSHRVKNMFSVIGAVVTMTARHEHAPGLAERINQRIRALGRAYEATLDDAASQSIALRPLVETVLRPYGRTDAEGDRIELDGGEVQMDASAISTLGLVLHELATNAVKHGALADRREVGRGCVRLAWSVDGGVDEEAPTLTLTWSERGGPAIAQAPDGAGTGTGIVDTLLAATGGSIEREWRADGLVATLRLPTRP